MTSSRLKSNLTIFRQLDLSFVTKVIIYGIVIALQALALHYWLPILLSLPRLLQAIFYAIVFTITAFLTTMLRRGLIRFEPVTRLGVYLLVLSITISVTGYATTHAKLTFEMVTSDFYANVGSELGSIAITIIVIDRLNRLREAKREVQQRKQNLIKQLGSQVNENAISAAEVLRDERWLFDGSLRGVELISANLQKAVLAGANLRNVTLEKAILNGVILNNADLEHASLKLAELRSAKLRACNFKYADLSGAYLEYADLSGADLTATELKLSNFAHAICKGAKLRNIEMLEGASFRNANLTGADCSNTDFRSTDLRGANLISAHMTYAKVSEQCFDEDTRLPDGSFWFSGIDITRFTNPKHASFFDPELS